MIEISVQGQKNTIKVKSSDSRYSLLKLLQQNSVTLKSSCNGNGSCGDCVVKILDGESNINPLTKEEKLLLGNVYFITKQRLACQVLLQGSVKIEI